MTEVDGVPPMTGVSGPLGTTVIEKASSATLVVPSLTVMALFEYVPTCAPLGVPDNLPLAVLKLAQVGQLEIETVSGLPAALPIIG